MKEKVTSILGLVDQNAEGVGGYITGMYNGNMTENDEVYNSSALVLGSLSDVDEWRLTGVCWTLE